MTGLHARRRCGGDTNGAVLDIHRVAAPLEEVPCRGHRGGHAHCVHVTAAVGYHCRFRDASGDATLQVQLMCGARSLVNNLQECRQSPASASEL